MAHRVEDQFKEMLWEHCQKFIKNQRIRCAETIYQADRVVVNACEFIEGVCDLVGYHRDEDDGDEEAE